MNNNQNVPNNGQQNLNNVSVIPNVGNVPQPNVINNAPMSSGNVIAGNNGTVVANPQVGGPITQNSQIVLGEVNNVNYADVIGNIGQNNAATDIQQAPINTINEEPPVPNDGPVTPTNQETYLNDMNVNGAYNKMEAPEYVNDQKVVENINAPKKNTITITKELKTIIIISLILLVFIFIMPVIFDLVTNIRFD